MSSTSPPTWVAPTAVAVTMVLWASAFVGIRHLGADFSPGALSLGRLLVGSAALGLVALRHPWIRPSRGDWWRLIAIGTLWYAIYNVALNEGEHHVDAGTAAMLLQLSPVLLSVLAVLFLGERFSVWLGVGLVVAFSGVALIATGSSEDSNRDPVGVALCLLAALVYSVSVVLQKPMSGRLRAGQITWVACTVGAVLCLPFAPTLWHEATAAPMSSLGWLIYLGVFPTAIAFTTYAYALTHMNASSLGVTTYRVPPITIVMGLVLLGEEPPRLAYLGGVVALFGVWLARRTPKVEPRVVGR